jgi:thioredoxin reductase (NADPH)
MAKPVILAVDDDPQVLRAVERDLRRNYAREYRILPADSGHSTLDELHECGDSAALFLSAEGQPLSKGAS